LNNNALTLSFSSIRKTSQAAVIAENYEDLDVQRDDYSAINEYANVNMAMSQDDDSSVGRHAVSGF